MGPQNGLLDDDFGMGIPETEAVDGAQVELESQARYAKSAEFKKLKDYLESRIKFYQEYLPSGEPVGTQDPKTLIENWVVANILVTEFSNVIAVYDDAAQTVKEQASARRKRT